LQVTPLSFGFWAYVGSLLHVLFLDQPNRLDKERRNSPVYCVSLAVRNTKRFDNINVRHWVKESPLLKLFSRQFPVISYPCESGKVYYRRHHDNQHIDTQQGIQFDYTQHNDTQNKGLKFNSIIICLMLNFIVILIVVFVCVIFWVLWHPIRPHSIVGSSYQGSDGFYYWNNFVQNMLVLIMSRFVIIVDLFNVRIILNLSRHF
jgi:hypothetical protein